MVISGDLNFNLLSTLSKTHILSLHISTLRCITALLKMLLSFSLTIFFFQSAIFYFLFPWQQTPRTEAKIDKFSLIFEMIRKSIW